MKKLSEYKNEEAMALIADLLEPFSRVCGNKAFLVQLQKGNPLKAAQIAFKKNPKDILNLFAILEGVPEEEYSASVPELIKAFTDLLNDPDIMGLFKSQGAERAATSSGSVSEK